MHRRATYSRFLTATVLCMLGLAAALFQPRPLRAEPAACPPAGHTRESLLELRSAGFAIADNAQRNALARGLLACVADPDPDLRDGVAFEGISTWLRGEQLSAETYQALYSGLLLQLQAAPDRGGFRQPFAALLLSEVARADRLQDRLDPDQRGQLVVAAADYLAGVRDYRGFSGTEGWRHGVAHGADLVLQLALNPAIEAAQLQRMLDAVATQVSPPGSAGEAVFYIYGEPGRLARAVFHAHSRGLLDAGYWQHWFEQLAKPDPLPEWSAAFGSQTGLAKRHNTLAFLLAMYLNATAANDAAATGLDALVMEALQQLP